MSKNVAQDEVKEKREIFHFSILKLFSESTPFTRCQKDVQTDITEFHVDSNFYYNLR